MAMLKRHSRTQQLVLALREGGSRTVGFNRRAFSVDQYTEVTNLNLNRASASEEEGSNVWQIRHFGAPPKVTRRSFLKTYHGVTWDDPYHWLRSSEDPAVNAYLQAENRYAESVMSETRGLQRQLRQEMASRMERELASPPERWENWLYYVHIPQGKEYAVYSRRRVPAGSTLPKASWKSFCAEFIGWDMDKKKNEVLVDVNRIAEEHGYAQLGVFKLSLDHRLLAYTVDLSGDEIFTLFIKDLEAGTLVSDHVIKGVVSVEWSRTGQSLYYTSANTSRRPNRVFLHNLKTQGEDIVVYEDEDPKNFVDVTRTKDWRYILINVNSKTSSEVFLVDSEMSPTTLQRFEKRTRGIQYFVEHHQGQFYILTNSSRKDKLETLTNNYRLVRCKLENLTSEYWQEIVSADSDCWIEDMDIFEKHLILYRRTNGLPIIQVLNLHNLPESDCPVQSLENHLWTLSLPTHAAVVTPGANSDFHSSILRLSISSPVMPEATYDVDLTTGKKTLLQQVQIPGINRPGTEAIGVSDSSAFYTMEHCAATSHDNVHVPLTIVHSKHLKRHGNNPALIIGYGAYGEMLDLSFSSDRMSLLDRGWVLAFAHVRGGGTLGKPWHCDGKLLKKKNSFEDISACIEHLIEKKYASRSKIAAWGESAGGLLIGGAVNMHPGLFRAIILKVPFLDILNTMLDSSLNLTEHEFDEWGDPSEKRMFEYIRDYSPYDNIRPEAAYPAMLITASFLDTRVGYWEAAKWVAALRHGIKENHSRPILLKTSMHGGHFGEGGRYQHLRDTASDYAFLIHVMGS